MTAPSIIATASVQGGSSTPGAAITIPASGTAGGVVVGGAVQATDFGYLLVSGGGGSGAPAAPSDANGTWVTVAGPFVTTSGNMRFAVYRRAINGSATVAPSWPSAPASGNNTAATLVVVRGAAGEEGVLAPTPQPGTASGVITIGNVTTTGPDRLVMYFTALQGNSGGFASTITWAGATKVVDRIASGTFYPSQSIAVESMPSAGQADGAVATYNYAVTGQMGVALAITPSVVALSVVLNAVPSDGVKPLAVAFTAAPSGGNGNPITYSMTYGDGGSSPSQSSPSFSHTYANAGEYDPVLSWSQST